MRLASWRAWVLQPWRSPGIAAALVGALSLPALVLTTGPMFRASAADAVTTRVVADVPRGPAGYDVSAIGTLDADVLAGFTTVIERRLAAIGPLGDPTKLLITDPVPVYHDGAEPSPRREVRVVARPGASDAVELLDGEADAGGIIVPLDLATDRELRVGDRVRLGTAGPITVTGIYRDVWDGPHDPYWDELGVDDVPRFQEVFHAPTFQMAIASEDVLVGLRMPGRARWSAPLEDRPTTFRQLQLLIGQYQQLPRDLVRDEALFEPYRRFATTPESPPSTFSALPPQLARADALIEGLEPAVRTATLAGVGAGLLLSTLGAVFVVRRRRQEFRLFAADGDSAWRFAGRGAVQYIGPALLGAALGVALAGVAVAALGPSRSTYYSVVPWGAVAVATAVAVVAGAVVTAVLGVRLADELGRSRPVLGRGALAGLAGLTMAMWIQVGDERARGADALVAALPVVGIATGVVAAVSVLRVALGALRHVGGSLPTPAFLAWRSLTASAAGAQAVTCALGLAAGLAVVSSALVTSMDDATAAKAATVVGANTRLDTADALHADVLPPGSTVVRTTTSQASGRPIDIVAIDPATFAAVVAWPAAFGSSPEAVIERLATPDSPGVPVLAVGPWPLAVHGEWGFVLHIPYDVVGQVASAPLASDRHPTLLVRADVLETFARERWDRGDEPLVPVDYQLDVPYGSGPERHYESPLSRFGYTVLSTQSADPLRAVAEEQGWRRVEIVTLTSEADAVESAAARWSFDYFRMLAAIGGVVALAAIVMYLAERRREREVTAVMTQAMGIRPLAGLLAAVAEMVVLTGVAAVSGAAAALIIARRLFPRFEPRPGLPPAAGVSVDLIVPAIMLLAALGVVSAAAAWTQRSASRARRAEVLRG